MKDNKKPFDKEDPKITGLPRKPKKSKKYSVMSEYKLPPSVILLNIIMIVVVLGICLAVFFIMFNKSLDEASDSSGSSSSALVPVSSQGSSSQSTVSSTDPDSSEDSTHEVSSSDNSSDENTSSDDESGTDSVSEPGSSESTDSSSQNITYFYNAAHFKDDLFIGDSIYTGLSLYGFIDADHVAAAIGYTPYKAMNSIFGNTNESALSYAAKMQPKRIFIMLGSNDMGGRDHSFLISSYDSFLSLLKESCPESTICVVSIPPVTADSSLASRSDISNRDIILVNAELRRMCKTYEALYFDLNSLVSDDDGYFKKQYAEIDGLHFVYDTYVLMLSELERITSD